MAFQFPAAPAPYATVLNDITGSTYQWRPDLTKWVITTKKAVGGDIIWEGDAPPDPIGDYKLWYSTDTLELYFHYCDANGVCAWVPTSAPITMLEDLDNTVFELRRDLNQTNVAVAENENRIGRTIEYSDTAPTIYPEIEVTTDIYDTDGVTVIGQKTEYFFNELNFKFWYDTTRLELLVLIKDADGDYSYVPVSLPLTDIDLDALNTQVQANSYANNQQNQAIEALEQLIFILKDELDALDNLSEDYFTSIVYHAFENVQTQYPLELVDKGPGWSGGGVTGQFFYDVADEPVHIGFKTEASTLKEFDPGLAVRITHTSGVMYARIKSSWHNGQVHLNLESQKGDAFVEGEFVTEFAIQENKFVERTGDSMTGELLMQDANINLNPGDIIFQPIVPDGDNDGARPERWNNIVSKRVRDANGNPISGSDAFGIRVDLTEGRTGYNKFEFFANVDGESTGAKYADFGGGNTPAFRFFRGNFQMEGNRIQKLGTAEQDTDAISLGQVKDELKDFKSEIIEQAAVGIFKWDTQSSNTSPVAGCFFGKQDVNNTTEPFINNFRVSNEDINGANQDFSTWEVGDIITWTNTINSAYQIRYRVNSVPTFQNGHYYFEVTFVSQTNLFMQGQDFILTRQRFTNIDFSDLETTYFRLDASNGPIETTPGLEIKTDVDTNSGFGEAALTLNGKRDNANNSCAAIRFKNWYYSDTDEINGYITYYSNNSKHYFRFNKDIDLISGVNLSFSNGGAIQHNGGDRIIFDAASNGNEGSGLVVFTRPGNTARRGVVIKGKYKNDDGDTVSDGDLFFSYTNSDIDAINYVGKISGKHNIVNKDYVDNAPTGVLEGKLKNKGSTGNPNSGQFVPMWGSSYNSGNVTDMNRIQLHSLDGYDFRTTGAAACPGTLTIMSRGDCLWHGIIEKKSVSGDTCTIYLIKLYARSANWDTSSDYYFHISGFKRDMS